MGFKIYQFKRSLQSFNTSIFEEKLETDVPQFWFKRKALEKTSIFAKYRLCGTNKVQDIASRVK